MQVNTKNLVSMTEANQNFSKVAKLVDENGAVVILKNNTPRYIVIGYDEISGQDLADDISVEAAAGEILAKHEKAFRKLAK